MTDRRRRALLSGPFLSGTNAITRDGKLGNLDMNGNRAGGIIFGPRHIVVVAGRNKIARDLGAAMARVKCQAAPPNAKHRGKHTPCTTAGRCSDCRSPDRTCNVWTITEKSSPKSRIKVVLVDEDLGLQRSVVPERGQWQNQRTTK